MKITLPWPDFRLSPNGRYHWRVVARAKQSAKMDAFLTTKATLARKIPEMNGDIRVQITIYPPDKRRRDEDNIIASLKASFDGIAQALQVDDSRFRLERPEWGEAGKPGKIEIELERAK